MGLKKEDKIRARVVREKTKCKDIIYAVKKLKMKYAGHSAGIEEEQ